MLQRVDPEWGAGFMDSSKVYNFYQNLPFFTSFCLEMSNGPLHPNEFLDLPQCDDSKSLLLHACIGKSYLSPRG